MSFLKLFFSYWTDYFKWLNDMGVKESDGDKEVIDDILGKLAGPRILSNITSFERMGRKSEKVRPIRVTLKNMDTKYDILSKAKNLKNQEEYKKVFVVPDLTRKQQEEDKKLRNKLKEIRDSGDKDVRIKKGKIVKNLNGAEVVIFPPRV